MSLSTGTTILLCIKPWPLPDQHISCLLSSGIPVKCFRTRKYNCFHAAVSVQLLSCSEYQPLPAQKINLFCYNSMSSFLNPILYKGSLCQYFDVTAKAKHQRSQQSSWNRRKSFYSQKIQCRVHLSTSVGFWWVMSWK